LSAFHVVPTELRAAATQVQGLIDAVSTTGTALAGPIEAAVGAHPEFVTSGVLEGYGARLTQVLEQLGTGYGHHAETLGQQAQAYEETDGSAADLFGGASGA
jgi:uncharacterized protein YukE